MKWGFFFVLFFSLNSFGYSSFFCVGLFRSEIPLQEKIFKTKQQIPVYYREYNQGAPVTVVLFHGMGESSESMNALAEILSKNYRVISIDMVGHGQSIKDITNNISMIDYRTNVENAKQLIESLKLKNFILAGHSYGGGIAIALAQELSIKPQQLILMAPYSQRLDQSNYENLKASMALLPSGMSESIIDSMVTPYLHKHYQDRFLSQWGKRYYELTPQEKNLLEKKITVAIATVRGIISLNILDKSYNLNWSRNLPMLILGGINDDFVPSSQLKKLNQRFQHAGAESKLYFIKNFDHDFPLNKPVKTAQIILNYLDNDLK